MRSVRPSHTDLIHRPALVLPAILGFAILLLWLPALGGSFQFDDWNVIVNEPRVHSLAAWWASMPGIRPLLKLSYALNISVGSSALGFRIVNVLVHAASTMLVFWLLRTRGTRAGLTPRVATLAAFLAAAIFAFHPVQTEAVTYISGRSSSLAAFFCLLSLWCWVRSEARAGWLIGSCLSYAAAVACKETALVLPLALLLYSADRPLRQTLVRLAPLALSAMAMLLVVWSLPTYRHLLAVSLETRSISENLVVQSHALLYLIGQLVRLWNGNADPSLDLAAGMNPWSVLLCTLWASALIAGLAYVRRAPVGAFAVLWFLLWLAPTNSLLPRLDLANDRQLYLALIGPAWWLAVKLASAGKVPIVLGAATVLVVLAAATFDRNRIYDTEVSFWEDTAARNPSSARAANNLGMAYAVACRPEDAAGEFKRSIELDAADYRARINLALLRRQALPGVDENRCATDAP